MYDIAPRAKKTHTRVFQWTSHDFAVEQKMEKYLLSLMKMHAIVVTLKSGVVVQYG